MCHVLSINGKMSETRRYLRDSDYKKAIFLSDLDKLTQGDSDTLMDAELDAKACVTSLLTDEYDIESEYLVGENIRGLDFEKEYFKHSHVIIDGRISKTKAYSNPSRPLNVFDFWRQMDIGEIDIEAVYESYSQEEGYFIDDIVFYDGVYFECLISNGVGAEYGSESIIQPIIVNWDIVEDGTDSEAFSLKKIYELGDLVSQDGIFYECVVPTSENGLRLYPNSTLWTASAYEIWSVITDYSSYDAILSVVNEGGLKYALINPANAIVGKSPSDSILDNDLSWSLIDARFYDRTERYLRPDGFEGYVYNEQQEHFYISEQDEGFVNGYTSENEKYLFSQVKDPRNRNIINCMIHLIIYQLCSVVVPDNVPTIRIDNYKSSMDKLKGFSTMKANPDIPRKVFTIITRNPMNGVVTETERRASRIAVNESKATRDSWTY